jgi:phenylacetate-CoA ligase
MLDGNGNRVSEPGAVAELVGTSFHNRAMPFIRYRTQDVGIVGRGPCSCGRNDPVLSDVEGRLQEFLVTADGRLVSVCVMGSAHFDVLDNVSETQYYQEKPGEVVFRLVPRPGYSDLDRRKIEEAVRSKLGRESIVIVQQVREIGRTMSGKHKMVDQRIPLDVLQGSQDHVLSE